MPWLGGHTAAIAISFLSLLAQAGADTPQQLADEVRSQGWIICYSARSESGDWDLFVCRPDGSGIRSLTRTPQWNEFYPQFSQTGDKLLYRRIPATESIDGNRYGAQGELVLAKADASEPSPLGASGEYPWATFGPEGSRIACLSIEGVTLINLEDQRVLKHLGRKGFFQQTVWSPDGQWLLGVANSFGTGWSVARMNLESGQVNPVNTVDCCTPDWAPDSQSAVFSWRPPGQKGNRGYGWTQLWLARADGSGRSLLFGQDGRHIYGGAISPDGRYVVFTGNMSEDGDPQMDGAPMGLMRLADAPIVAEKSVELRGVHPQANEGPVLTLPVGYEPTWSRADVLDQAAATPEPDVAESGGTGDLALSEELSGRGWIAFSMKTQAGDWDLFAVRPDGSDRRRLSSTPEYNEAGARFSPDGKRLLYYRMGRNEPLDNNTYGVFDLIISAPDGSNPVNYGRDYPWASWGPNGAELACLKPGGIEIVDVATRTVSKRLPRQGIVQQLVWAPDGKHFAGTANGLGPYWNIGCLDDSAGEISAVAETVRYNCTPDWMPNAQQVIFARGIIPEEGGKAELWLGEVGGSAPRLLYAEAERHIYGACASPDGRYLLFTRSVEDLGKVDNSRTTIAVMRMSDTPVRIGAGGDPVDGASAEILDLGYGWEPHWTYAEIFENSHSGNTTSKKDTKP